METVHSKQLEIDIQSNITQHKNYYLHSIIYRVSNSFESEIFDISVFLFVDENRIPFFSQCIKKIPVIRSKESEEFIFEYKSKLNNPLFYSRLIFRLKGETSHRFINIDFPKQNNDNIYSIDSFVALLKIKGLKRIIDVFPVTNGISFTNFGTILDTFVNITYSNYSNEILNHELCNSTLLKCRNTITLNNISYGNFQTISFGNSILLEIPIIVE